MEHDHPGEPAPGIDTPGRLADVHADDWERVIRVNLIGTAAVDQAILSTLEERRGHL